MWLLDFLNNEKSLKVAVNESSEMLNKRLHYYYPVILVILGREPLHLDEVSYNSLDL